MEPGFPIGLDNPALAPPAGCDEQADAGVDPNLPRTCVDWCDALAFCAWAGKDLCRDDGSGLTDDALSSSSDWFRACAGTDAANRIGCKDSCDYSSCNGASSGDGKVEPVTSFPACVVAYDEGPGIFDLSGNVSEWTGWCSPNTPNGNCLVRGGSFASSDVLLQCRGAAPTVRTATLPTLGFRCCTDAE